MSNPEHSVFPFVKLKTVKTGLASHQAENRREIREADRDEAHALREFHSFIFLGRIRFELM